MRRLAELLADQGRTGELRARADELALVDGGESEAPYAAARLADLLAGQGRTDEAIQLRRHQVEAGIYWAVEPLAALIVEQGHIDEAARYDRCHARPS